MSKVEFSPYKWKCPLCNYWHRVRGIWKDGEYIKRCKCGGWARLQIILRETYYKQPLIKSAEDI